VLMSMEWGQRRRHGFMASLPQLGVPIGLLLSTGAVRLVSGAGGEDFFLSWGWRIPFLASVVLIAVGLYVRLQVLETPHFAKVRERKAVARRPVWEVLRTQPRAVLTSMFVRMAEQAPFYLFITFVLTYGTEGLGLDRNDLLDDTLVAAAIGFVTVPLFGYLSDIFGRRLVYGVGIVAVGIYAFPYFGLLNTKEAGLVLLAIVLSLVGHDVMYGPQAALIAETFETSVRYSGARVTSSPRWWPAGRPAHRHRDLRPDRVLDRHLLVHRRLRRGVDDRAAAHAEAAPERRGRRRHPCGGARSLTEGAGPAGGRRPGRRVRPPVRRGRPGSAGRSSPGSRRRTGRPRRPASTTARARRRTARAPRRPRAQGRPAR